VLIVEAIVPQILTYKYLSSSTATWLCQQLLDGKPTTVGSESSSVTHSLGASGGSRNPTPTTSCLPRKIGSINSNPLDETSPRLGMTRILIFLCTTRANRVYWDGQFEHKLAMEPWNTQMNPESVRHRANQELIAFKYWRDYSRFGPTAGEDQLATCLVTRVLYVYSIVYGFEFSRLFYIYWVQIAIFNSTI
jgi:hypothetical protein